MTEQTIPNKIDVHDFSFFYGDFQALKADHCLDWPFGLRKIDLFTRH